MLTSNNIVEILDGIGQHVNVKLSRGGVLFTKDGEDAEWTRQGIVHDVDEATKTIDGWFAKNRPEISKRMERGMKAGVKVMAVGDDGSMEEIPGDFDGLTLEELVGKIRNHEQKHSATERVAEHVAGVLDEMVEKILNLPEMSRRGEGVSDEDWEILLDGAKQTGIPPMLLGAMVQVVESEDTPGCCNCGHCIAHRLYPEVDPADLADLAKFAAIKRIASTRGPQQGPCRLSAAKKKAMNEATAGRMKEALKSKKVGEMEAKSIQSMIDQLLKPSTDGSSKKPSTGNKSGIPRWFPVKKVEGEQ